jgi:hypothetical protein
VSGLWPWSPDAWKPKGLLRDLVRAGALYQAAIDVCGPNETGYAAYLRQARDEVAARLDALLDEAREMLADDSADYIWRVTNTAGNVVMEMGAAVPDGISDEALVHAMGEQLIKLGTQLMRSTVSEADDQLPWEPVSKGSADV